MQRLSAGFLLEKITGASCWRSGIGDEIAAFKCARHAVGSTDCRSPVGRMGGREVLSFIDSLLHIISCRRRPSDIQSINLYSPNMVSSFVVNQTKPSGESLSQDA